MISGTLHSSQPAYLYSALHAYHSTRSLRLSNTNLLSVPFVRTSFGAHGFRVAAPRIWNSPAICSNVYIAPTLFIVFKRFTILSRPSNPLNAFLLAPHIRLLLTIGRVYIYIGWSDVTYLWSQCDCHFIGQHVVLCVVKWWRFVALFEKNWVSCFKKMSALSLSYWESNVYWRQNNKHFAELAPQNGGNSWYEEITSLSPYVYIVFTYLLKVQLLSGVCRVDDGARELEIWLLLNVVLLCHEGAGIWHTRRSSQQGETKSQREESAKSALKTRFAATIFHLISDNS